MSLRLVQYKSATDRWSFFAKPAELLGGGGGNNATLAEPSDHVDIGLTSGPFHA